MTGVRGGEKLLANESEAQGIGAPLNSSRLHVESHRMKVAR